MSGHTNDTPAETDGSGGSDRGGGISSVGRAFDIAELLATETTLGVTAVAEELGVAKSTAHDHLSTLAERGYVVRAPEGYRLGMEFLRLGEAARSRDEAYEIAREKVEKLANETNERSQFIVEEAGRAIYVHREVGPDAVHTDSAIGGHVPLYATAAGKALLSHHDDDRVRELVGDNLDPITDNTVTEVDALLAELETVRERGYATNCAENTPRLRAVGAPVELPDGRPLGAISVSGPTHRMKGERFESELPDLLLGTVNELELNIAYA